MSAKEPGIDRIIKRDGTVVPYDRERIATAIFKAAASVGGTNRSVATELVAGVEQELIETYGGEATPSVEEIQDVVEQVLIDAGHARTARAYIIYRHERAEARAARELRFETSDNIPYKKIYEVLRWNMRHGCDTVTGLNEINAQGGFPELVTACNERYIREVQQGAQAIAARLPDVRMVIIAGPSSSGKTTTLIKMSETLRQTGITGLVGINIDHYFFDLEQHPRDEFGDYDYETPQALDLALINQHLAALLDGQTIRTPHYDFKSGKRTLEVHELKLGPDQILLIDSLHGLYEPMSASVPARNKFRLYIETLGQVQLDNGVFMRWADNRLMRRMIRDSWHRNLKPLETLTHWHYVRRSELRNIIPFIKNVDYLVNSALPYELPLLRHRLFEYFPEGIAKYKADPKRQDAYIRAQRVHDFLRPLHPVADDQCVPPDALVREFIGGSHYVY